MFSVDFATIPFCYKYMHYCMPLRYKRHPLAFVDTSVDVHARDVNSSKGGHLFFLLENDLLDKDHESDHYEKQQVLHLSVRASNLAGRSAQ